MPVLYSNTIARLLDILPSHQQCDCPCCHCTCLCHRCKGTTQGLDGTTWKDFASFLFERLKPTTMRNVNIEKCYLEARKTPGQTVSNFTAYLNQLESQLPLPISKPQRARDLFHRLQPNISQEIFCLADIPTRRFKLEALAICIKETTRNNCRQAGFPEPSTRGRGRVQLLFCKRATNSTTVQTNSQFTVPVGQGRGGLIKCYNCGIAGHILRNCRLEPNNILTAVHITEATLKSSAQ